MEQGWSLGEIIGIAVFVLLLITSTYKASKAPRLFSWRLSAFLLWLGFICIAGFILARSSVTQFAWLHEQFWLLPVGYAVILAGLVVIVFRFIVYLLQKLFGSLK